MNEEMDSIAERLTAWYNGEKNSPDMVQIYPTNGCNLKCIFCVQQLGIYDLGDTVSKKRWFETTREICEMRPREILISGGGEPLFTPELTIGIMEIIKKNGISGRLITNGTLWRESDIKKVVDIDWDHVIFSIDGLEKTHDFLRGVEGCFKKILEAVKLFNETKQRLTRSKPSLEMTTVLNIHNYKEIVPMVELASSLKLKSMNLEPICINNPEDAKLRLDLKKRIEFFEGILPDAKRMAEKYGIGNNFESLEKIKSIEKTGELKEIILKKSGPDFLDSPCFEPWIWPKIEANGEVWPCSTVSLKENIREKSFKEIWFGEKFKKFRDRILRNDLPEGCNNCVITHTEKTNMIREKLRFKI